MHLSFGDAAAYHADTLETMPERYTTPVRLRLEMARYVLAEDYVRALEGRDGLRRAVDRAMAGYDALVLPTLPIPAPIIGASSVQIDDTPQLVRSLMLRLTQLFNVTGHPAISLPCGTTAEGLPCGLQLVGEAGETSALLDIAAMVEAQLVVRS
jgi:aspartyl-tRNA(Asn)/glutamyl-tRNA(Gln) amidotransferase subunit A